MLRRVKGLHGDALSARNGDVGRVDQVLFDDEHWTVRYLVVDTGGWLGGRKVLVTPSVLGSFDWNKRLLTVNLTREQVEGSPSVETDVPVSRQWEQQYHDYYAWPYYWAGGLDFGDAEWRPGAPIAQRLNATGADRQPLTEHHDAHLRGTKEVSGYGIIAWDGRVGHVDDFMVDDRTWKICYMAVDTQDWWPGKKVLLPPEVIKRTSWPNGTVTVQLTRDQVQSSPEWDSHEPISRAFDDELSAYYAQLSVGPQASKAEWTEAFA